MPNIEDLLVVSSKQMVEMLVVQLGNTQSLFDELMEIMYRDVYPVSMRAAWVATYVAEKHPELAHPHIPKICSILPDVKVDGVKRCILKILMNTSYKFSDDDLGILADIAFTLASDPSQAIAVRAFSLDILLIVLKTYPEITPELIAVMESIIPDGSSGLKNKCIKTIKKLQNPSTKKRR